MTMNYLGVRTRAQYAALGEHRRYLGVRVAYNLLDVGDSPSEIDIRTFEDVCFTLRLANSTFRTSFRKRFADLNQVVQPLLRQHFSPLQTLTVQDRAVSHALTSTEWAKQLLLDFPQAAFEASDLTLWLLALNLHDGTTYIAEPDGTVLQAIRGPFVVSMYHPESLRFPLHRIVSALERRRLARLDIPAQWHETDGGDGYRVRRFSFIHPEANQLAAADPRFTVIRRSVFDHSDPPCHVLRTMNILNRDYFSEQVLTDGVAAVFTSLLPGGIWIIGRTTEVEFRNHASILQRQDDRFVLLERHGDGSEMEPLALAWRPSA